MNLRTFASDTGTKTGPRGVIHGPEAQTQNSQMGGIDLRERQKYNVSFQGPGSRTMFCTHDSPWLDRTPDPKNEFEKRELSRWP